MWITWVLHSSTNLGPWVESKDKPKLPSCTSTFFPPTQGAETLARAWVLHALVHIWQNDQRCFLNMSLFEWRERPKSKESKYWQVVVKVTIKCPAWTTLWLSEWSEWSSDHRTWQHSDKAYLNRLGNETFVTCDTLCSTLCDTLVTFGDKLSCMLDSSLQGGYLLACNTTRKQCERAARGQSDGKTWETLNEPFGAMFTNLDWKLHLPNLF